MKRLFFIVIMLLLLSGCSQSKVEPPIREEDFNNQGDRTVLLCGEKTFPISFTFDGEQKIENGLYFYYDMIHHYGREWSDSFYLYDTRRLELFDYDKCTNFRGRECFATNGNWPLFLNPVHTEYSASNQGKIDVALLEAGTRILNQNNMKEQPLVITDVWQCDMDNDGVEERFIKACNYIVAPNEMAEKSVASDEIHIYAFLAYVDEDNCQLLSGSFRSLMNEPKDDQAESVLASFTYDKHGNMAQTILKKRQKYALIQDLIPLICDPDGDQIWSVYLWKKSDFDSLVLMDLQDGCFIKRYEILF